MPFKHSDMTDESTFKAHLTANLRKKEYIYRNIMLINDLNDDRILTERAPVAIDKDNNVYFRELIIHLRDQNLIQHGSSICYYDQERKIFVHSGREPLPYNSMVPLSKFGKEEIKIKYRAMDQIDYRYNRGIMCPTEIQNQSATFQQSFAQNSAFREQQWLLNSKLAYQAFNINNGSTSGLAPSSSSAPICASNSSQMVMNIYQAEEEEQGIEATAAIPREKRVKERRIGYVHERVLEWRKYYENGYMNENGSLVKMNLDAAAGKVGLSRKTLDDYYKYIRKAEQFNFDFKLYANEKIGVLRNFVRDREKRANHGSQLQQGQTQMQQQPKQSLANNMNIDEEYDEIDDDEDEETQSKSASRKAAALPGSTQNSRLVFPRSKQSTFTLRASSPVPRPQENQQQLQQIQQQNYQLAPYTEENEIPAERRVSQVFFNQEQEQFIDQQLYQVPQLNSTFSYTQQYYGENYMDMEVNPIDFMTNSTNPNSASGCQPNITGSFDVSMNQSLVKNPSIGELQEQGLFDIQQMKSNQFCGASPQDGFMFDEGCDFMNGDDVMYRNDYFADYE